MATSDDRPSRAFLQRLRARLEKMVDDGKITKEELDKVLREEAGRVGGLTSQQRRRESATASEITDFRLLWEFAEPPATINVLPVPGTYRHPVYGSIKITKDRNEQFVQNFKDGVYQDRLPIDAEHETKLSGAFGWMTDLSLNEDGSVEAAVEWTERGQSAIEKDLFKYFSPEWYDEWQDPISGNKLKDVIIGGALTTRPFFKDPALRPLVATELQIEDFSADIFSDLPPGMSYGDLQSRLNQAIQKVYPSTDGMMGSCWVTDVFEDYLIYCDPDGNYLRLSYDLDEDSGEVSLGESPQRVERMTLWKPSTFAEWDTSYINDLPDSAFAVILPGGKKEDGKTTPKSLRMLPHHKEDGSIDLPHLRNALSREPQADMPDDYHARAKRHLEAHAKEEGVGKQTSDPDPADVHVPKYMPMMKKRRPSGMGKTTGEPVQMTEEELQQFIEENPLLKKLKEQADTAAEENTKLKTQLDTAEATVKAATETAQKAQEAAETLVKEARRKRFSDLVMGRTDEQPHRWFGELDTHVKMLEALADSHGEDSDLFKAYVEQNNAHSRQLKASKAFQEEGVSGNDSPTSAAAKIEAGARKLATEKSISYVQAYGEFIASEEGQNLYNESVKDHNRAIRRGGDE